MVAKQSDELLTLVIDEQSIPNIPIDETITLDIIEGYRIQTLTLQYGDSLILNFGDAGILYNSTATYNRYIKLPSGATAWQFSTVDDCITIPSGAAVDSLSDFTLEYQFYLTSMGGRLWSKKQHVTNEDRRFAVYIDNDSSVVITRATIENVDEWRTIPNTITTNVWHYLQVVWASSIGPSDDNPPTFYLDNVKLDVTHTLVGSSLWADDIGTTAAIGNVSEGVGYNINGILSVCRLYRTARSPGECTSNYLSDLWRIHDPAIGAMEVPG